MAGEIALRAVSVKAGSSPNTVASYSYDAFGQLTAASENFGGTTTWTNPYRYDGQDFGASER